MTWLRVAVVFTFAMSPLAMMGCHKSPNSESEEERDEGADAVRALTGTWQADMSTFEMDAFDSAHEEDLPQVMAALAAGQLRVTYNADGSYSTFYRDPLNGTEYTTTGTWQVTFREGHEYAIRVIPLTDSRSPEHANGPPEDLRLRVVDANSLMMMGLDQGGSSISVRMNRQ